MLKSVVIACISWRYTHLEAPNSFSLIAVATSFCTMHKGQRRAEGSHKATDLLHLIGPYEMYTTFQRKEVYPVPCLRGEYVPGTLLL